MPALSLKKCLLFGHGHEDGAVTDVHLDENGCLLALGEKPADFEPDQTIDLTGKWLVANLTDISARLTIPEYELRTSLRHELSVVQSAGVAQVLMKPHQGHFVDHSDHVRQLRRICREFDPEVGVCASLYRQSHTGDDYPSPEKGRFIDFCAIREAGCREIDIPARTRYTTRTIEKAMIIAESLDMRLNLTALDPDLAGTGCCHQGGLAARLGLDGISDIAESASMLLHLELAAHTGCRLHFSQLSSARAVEIFARARQDNPRISADVGISHLQLTVDNLAGYNGLYHTIPPLREESDRQELLAAVNHGVIECIVSAHTPLSLSDKCNPFPGVKPGISAIDTFIPQLTSLIDSGALNRDAAVAAISSRPDAIFRHSQPQPLEAGQKIALTVVDAEHRHRWRLEDIASNGKNNANIGRTLSGRALYGLNRGRWRNLPAPGTESTGTQSPGPFPAQKNNASA